MPQHPLLQEGLEMNGDSVNDSMQSRSAAILATLFARASIVPLTIVAASALHGPNDVVSHKGATSNETEVSCTVAMNDRSWSRELSQIIIPIIHEI